MSEDSPSDCNLTFKDIAYSKQISQQCIHSTLVRWHLVAIDSSEDCQSQQGSPSGDKLCILKHSDPTKLSSSSFYCNLKTQHWHFCTRNRSFTTATTARRCLHWPGCFSERHRNCGVKEKDWHFRFLWFLWNAKARRELLHREGSP